MNDGVFFLVAIIFIFVLWVYSGGPNHPISFSGPYLTPITNVNQESEGYGPSANQFYGKGTTLSRYTASNSANTQIDQSAVSPYSENVRIEGGNPQATIARDEYVVISANTVVTVTGWQLVSQKSDSQIRIPEGTHGESSSKRSIRLERGDELYVVTGSRSTDTSSSSRYAWRAFLGNSSDLWERNDTITLLDANGKVVDQYSY